MKTILSFAVSLCFLVLSSGPLRADPLDNWTSAEVSTNPPGFGGFQFLSAAYGNGRFVSVGQYASDDNGVIETSEDGFRWTMRTSRDLAVRDLYDVTFGNGVFVAVGWGYFDGQTIYSSTNGIDWVPHVTATYNINAVTFGENLFIAVGDAHTWQSGAPTNKNIYASSDGITWDAIDSGATHNIMDVAFGAGLFVAVNGNGYAYFSDTGYFWNTVLKNGLGGKVSFCNGLFMVPGGVGTNYVSSDGLNWSAVTNSSHSTFGHIIYADGMYVAQTSSNVFSSVDGTNWVERGLQLPSNVTLTDISVGNQKFLVTGFAYPSSPAVKPVAYLSDPLIALGINRAFPPQIALSGLTGRNYRVEFLADIRSTNWRILTNFTLTNSPTVWVDNQPTNANGFYRAVLLP